MEEVKNNNITEQVKFLINQSKIKVANAVNTEVSWLYWQVGNRIKHEILQNQRAEYGKEIISSLSISLSLEYGRGWSKRQLHHCVRFAEVFSDSEIVYTLCSQLSWSHLRLIIPIDEPQKRDFYIEICKLEKWSVRVFQERIQSMLYERTTISKKPEVIIQSELELLRKEQKISPNLVFKDPYILDFLELQDTFSEKDLETSILAELQRFITELGTDFAFLARQKRITVDHTDYYMDLLFYHRRLKCLIVVDLKIGNFEASFKGQMELYLRYLEKHEQIEGENSPIGLILCSGKNEEHIELMQLDKSNIRVAEYLTLLPSKELLKQKLQLAIEIAKNRIEINE